MSDIFSEVDEEVRKDQSLVLWKKYGPYIIALAVVVMVVTGSVIGWRNYQKSQRLAAAGTFLSAASVSGETARSGALKGVADNDPGIYGALAQIRLAMEMAETNPDRTLEMLDTLAGSPSISLSMRQLAEIRAASIAADSKPASDVLRRVTPLLVPSHAFRFSARELAAVAEYELGNPQAARMHLQTLIEDQLTPSGIRARTEALLAVIGEGERS